MAELRWLGFAALVGLNQGAVTLTLALASSVVGVRHAGLESGVLFGSYTASALLLAVPIVRALGARNSASGALFVQGAYVVAYFIAGMDPLSALPICIVGSALGGLASGCLWTAQGAYFSLFAKTRATQLGAEPSGGVRGPSVVERAIMQLNES